MFAIARVGTSLRISKTLNKSILGAPCVYVLSMGQTCSLRVSSHRRPPSLEIQQRRLNELSYHERDADVVHMIILESEISVICSVIIGCKRAPDTEKKNTHTHTNTSALRPNSWIKETADWLGSPPQSFKG